MQKQLITLFSKIRLPNESVTSSTTNHAAAFNKELALFGYTLDGDTLRGLESLSKDDFGAIRAAILPLVSNLSGAKANHAVLFNKFPYETPDGADYLARRIYGDMQTTERHNVENATFLSCGHLIDPRLFNLDDFGACPICQRQVDELASPEEVCDEFKSVTSLKVLSTASDEYIVAQANKMLARNASLSMEEREFLRQASDEFTLTAPDTVFNENLPFVYRIVDNVAPSCKGATDILRIAYYLSDEKADLSLKDNIKFKVSTRDKKKLMALLNGMNNLEEDMMRNRERWLRLGERLNPNSKVNIRRFPRVATAFDTLRNRSAGIETFNRVVERKVRTKTIDSTLVDKLAQRPGEFMRRLDFLLRTKGATDYVIKTLDTVLPQVRSKMLMEIMKYFEFRASGKQTDRLFIPKGKINKMQVVADKRAPIDAAVAMSVHAALMAELVRRFVGKTEPMGKVFLEQSLKGLVLPYNQRGDSATTSAIQKGSRYPISSDAKVLRLFVHWTGRDVDLSANLFNDDFSQEQTVYFGNLRSGSVYHSGDIQHAPNGASEFIDIDIDDIAKTGFRYVAMSVISYTGEHFDTFPCFAGFMERDKVKSGARYEAESVALKFEINTPTTSHMPLVFDAQERQIIYLDVAGGSSRYGAASRNKKFGAMTKAALLLPDQKPTAHDLLLIMALANEGTLVDTADEADVVFSSENVNVNDLALELA